MADLSNPIINGPYDEPARHFELGPQGPTGAVIEWRRPSESFIPIAPVRKRSAGEQEQIDFDVTGERRERNSLINELRKEVQRWRDREYERVTPISRKLLQHWADPERENRVLFCQREAAETAIFLAEVAGRHGYTDWRQRLDEQNLAHNAGLPRVALKMATGTGKTVVMAMLIAWQTLNKAASPRDARFTNRFLIITPGITIRDRLRVLLPSDAQNCYEQRDLIPADLAGHTRQARIAITNYHSFLLRDAREIKGVSKATRQILLAGRNSDPFRETPAAMVARVLRDLSLGGAGQVVVLNDEAHHCYSDRPINAVPGHSGGPRPNAEERKANDEARVWFRGIQAIAKTAGVKSIYDLSATPFYLAGSGYNEGYIFPWTVSDFSLMDAIESGIVKVPRTPVDDDAQGSLVTYLRLWDYVGDQLPKKKAPAMAGTEGWIPPPELEGALKSLYASYRRAFDHWQQALAPLGEPPPVFIIVCPNTVVSRLVYEWVAGREITDTDAEGNEVRIARPGNLPLFSNYVDGNALRRPPSALIDSAQLESGEALSADFRQAAAAEIETFKSEYRRRNPGADTEKISDEDLLREVMNTVGRKGRLGEDIRCVVSVAMLTEGWDANTVTHILGVRAFRSQLLCEQVVGRGLRRRSYAVNDEGRFEPEYANVYGIPFAFIPSDQVVKDTLPPTPAIEVASVPGRENYRITFPKLDGYRLEIPDGDLWFDPAAVRRFGIGSGTVPTQVEVEGIVGTGELVKDDDWRSVRPQGVAYAVARRLLDEHIARGADRRPWLFPKLVRIVRQWLDECVDVEPGFSLGYLLASSECQAEAAELIYAAITTHSNRRARLRPMLRRFDPVGSTADVRFLTRKAVVVADKSEVSHVTLDGKGGNTWEQILALECERDRRVAAYAKNDHLGFTIPYIHQGRTHSYVPDFLLRLVPADSADFDRTLIVEVSGGQKSPGPTATKASTARDSWCAAVNNHGGFGRWGYLEVKSMAGVQQVLSAGIDDLYRDAPIIGDPDLLDTDTAARVRRG